MATKIAIKILAKTKEAAGVMRSISDQQQQPQQCA